MSKELHKTTGAQRASSARQYAKIKSDPVKMSNRLSRQRQRRLLNPERQREYSRRWRIENPEKYKESYQRSQAKNPDYPKQWRKRKVAENYLPLLLKNARNRAKQRGLPFTLTPENCPTIPTHCPVLGIPLDSRDRHHHRSLDRINPDKSIGYTPGNVRWVSQKWNRMKGNHTLETARLLVRDLERP